ncbi:FtsK/SpoIIIE domain-containing protein, partial [Singulisphaera rosea]
MSDMILQQKEAESLQTLERLSAERAKAEYETERGFRIRKETEERGFQEAFEKLTSTGKAEIRATEARYQSVKAELKSKFAAERAAGDAEYAEVRRKIAAKSASARKSAKKVYEESKWQILAVFEAAKDNVLRRYKQADGELAAALEQLQIIREDSEGLVQVCRKFLRSPAEENVTPPEVTTGEDPLVDLHAKIKQAEEQLVPLSKISLLNFLQPQQFVWPFILLAGALAYPLGTTVGWPVGVSVACVLGIVAGVGVRIWLNSIVRGKIEKLFPPFNTSLLEADVIAKRCGEFIKANFEQGKVEIEQRREGDTKAAEEKSIRSIADAEKKADEDNKQADEKYPAQFKEIEQRRVEAVQQADERYPKKIAELKEKLERESNLLQENYRVQKETTQKAYLDAWTNLIDRWKQGTAAVQATVDEVNEVCNHLFFPWHREEPEQWESPKAVPPALRFGEFTIDMEQIPNGIPTDPRLKGLAATSYTLPALVPFPTLASMLIRMSDNGKNDAALLLQAMMLRYLTSIPAGKVRFTIIDPVSLGEHFAAFMHLADYSELLVNSRIWTEASHIEQKLTDLQAHMENVIQKYLRNEFETIEDYNIHAGEVAEPFRILVVSNFPANFNESATRRLMSIASSGARCGVFTLISVDTKLQVPSGFQVKDLEQYAVNLTWKEGKFVWREENFSKFPLQLDKPPTPDAVTKLMHIAGDRARNANRVEVPFEFIAPKPEEYWTYSTSKGVDVPLGRAGATKLQHMKLGKGTSQHVLIAGKTGSGKSTLLHALIVNSILRYSPDELQLYLIDFKKGVEFKVYAAYQLPHAKVIAVESEREFGLSVLQRLDLELKARGDKFRDLGVQDLNGYRQIEGQP